MIPTEPIGSIPRPPELLAALNVQVDFTEGRLAVKLDPSGALLTSFIDHTNLALRRFNAAARARIDQRRFIDVTAPIDPVIETPELVRDRVLQAAAYIPLARLGTTDDCGFAPFCDDLPSARDTAFARIRARVEGTALAAALLEGPT